MTELLAPAYPWLKTLHIVFVIFWMAGLFAFPRFLVYHQEALADPAECARWVEREGKLHRIILTPSLVMVWLAGLSLAAAAGAWGDGWLHAKLLLVLGLSAFHGWMVGYARRLGRPGARLLTGRRLRLVNEIPGIAVIAIVALVVVKPF